LFTLVIYYSINFNYIICRKLKQPAYFARTSVIWTKT